MIEAYMKGTEVTCGCYKTKDKEVVFPITEVVTDNEFFDYDAKYNGQVQEITPARLPEDTAELLEINTTPGMTATSFIPQQVRAAGLDIKDVMTDIIENKF